MATALSRSVAIPDIILSSMKEVFDANITHMVKDIAKTLNKDPTPLLQAIKSQKGSIYIFDESSPSEIDMRCQILCQKPAAPLFCQPCGRPILWSSGLAAGTERCAEHAYHSNVSYSLPVLYPIETETEEKYFVGEDDTVYNIEYKAVGTYDRDTCGVSLFVISASADKDD
jgi:hypothetical protein